MQPSRRRPAIHRFAWPLSGARSTRRAPCAYPASGGIPAAARRSAREYRRNDQFDVKRLRPDQLLHATLRHLPSLVQHDDPVAERLHVGEDVGAEKHRLPRRLEIPDDAAHLHPAHRVQPRHRFVEDHEFRVVQQRLGQPQPLHHPLGIFPDRSAPGSRKPDPGEELRRAGLRVRAGHPAQLAAKAKELPAGEIFVEVRLLRHEADAAANVGPVPDLPAEQGHLPRVREREAVQDLDRGRLPGAVGSEEPDDLVLVHLARQIRQHADRFAPETGRVRFRQPLDGEDRPFVDHFFWNTRSRCGTRLLRTFPPRSIT